ncbi:MAG: FadR family transcriptional regulator [Betaproteobacteria bacterium]|nr:FadR family transcriptional regulator [Betaproteobacteria bacterium]
MLNLYPIHVPKAADVLADNLREQILDGRLRVGAIFPNERDLAEQAGLSRASVREALRILEVEGLIATRTGRNGGSEVIRPSLQTIERSIGIFIRGQNIRLASVLEVREAIEPYAARLAALHRTDDDLEVLRECHRRLMTDLHDVAAFLRANLEWHVNLVHSAHNELLSAFVNAFAQTVYQATDLQEFSPPDIRATVARAHQVVMDAIEAGDADAAWRRMARHVGAYVGRVKSLGPDAMG